MVEVAVPPLGPAVAGAIGAPLRGALLLLIGFEALAVAVFVFTGAGVGLDPAYGISRNSTIFPLQFPGFAAKAVFST